MRITCPVCAATYDVPDQMLRSGRKVRCGSCGEQWMATAPAAAASPPDPAPDQTVAAPRAMSAPPPPPPAPPPSEITAAVASAAPAARAAAEAEPPPAAGRHPLLAVVGAEPAPRAAAPPPPPTIAREPPPPSVWDRLTDASEQPKPLFVSEPLQPGRGGVAMTYDEAPVPRRAGAAVWLGWILSLVIWGLVAWAAY